MVVEEVTRVEQEWYLIKAVSQGKQGAWTRWEETTSWVVSWADVWGQGQQQLYLLLERDGRCTWTWASSESAQQRLYRQCLDRMSWCGSQLPRESSSLNSPSLERRESQQRTSSSGSSTPTWRHSAGTWAELQPSTQWKSDAGASSCSWNNRVKSAEELAEKAEKASFWLWLRRRDSVWGSGVPGSGPHSATAAPPGDVLGGGRNISEWWCQLTTLQLTQWALEEVQQAETPSRKNTTSTKPR